MRHSTFKGETEAEIATRINDSLKGLAPHVAGLERIAPHLTIGKRRNSGERRPEQMIRTFVYASQGYHWLPQSKTPIQHKPGRFWQTVPAQSDQYAYSMSFQATVLNHYKKTGQFAALKLVAANLAEFFPVAPFLKAADPKGRGYNNWAMARPRAECLIDFACTVHERAADSEIAENIAWDLLRTEVIEAVKICLRAELPITNVPRVYARLHFILLVARFFQESAEFHREAYDRAMAATLEMIDHQFDDRGAYRSGQERPQRNVAPHVKRIVDFVEANGFEPDESLERARQRLAAIEAAEAQLTGADGTAPN